MTTLNFIQGQQSSLARLMGLVWCSQSNSPSLMWLVQFRRSGEASLAQQVLYCYPVAANLVHLVQYGQYWFSKSSIARLWQLIYYGYSVSGSLLLIVQCCQPVAANLDLLVQCSQSVTASLALQVYLGLSCAVCQVQLIQSDQSSTASRSEKNSVVQKVCLHELF